MKIKGQLSVVVPIFEHCSPRLFTSVLTTQLLKEMDNTHVSNKQRKLRQIGHMDHGLGIVPQQIPLDEPTNQNLESKFELLAAVVQIQQTRHHHTLVN